LAVKAVHRCPLLSWAVDDVRPYWRDAQGNKIDRQRLWQVLTMREGRIVRIQDYTDQATALQAAGLPTGP
jgi:ketosteroid isomerase-like protein